MIYTKLKELKKRQKRSNLSQTVKNDESSFANPKKLKWRERSSLLPSLSKVSMRMKHSYESEKCSVISFSKHSVG